MKTNVPDKGRSGFTLVELLVATVILVLIVTVLSTLISRASQAWIYAESQNQRRSTGRSLLQIIARDLEMARIPGSYPSGNASKANLQFVTSPEGAAYSAILNPHALFFHAPVATDRSRGDMASIGYFVRWDTTSQPGTAKAQLCRFNVDPSDTQNYLIYSSGSGGLPADWINIDTLDAVAPSTAETNYRGWFADNVIALWIRCLDSAGRPILTPAQGTAINGGYGFDSRLGYLNPTTNMAHPPPALPPCVEVTLITVDPSTAKLITAPITLPNTPPRSPSVFDAPADTPGSLAHFLATVPAPIRPGIQIFSTRVYLKNSQRAP